jgi:hypothetical protein
VVKLVISTQITKALLKPKKKRKNTVVDWETKCQLDMSTQKKRHSATRSAEILFPCFQGEHTFHTLRGSHARVPPINPRQLVSKMGFFNLGKN